MTVELPTPDDAIVPGTLVQVQDSLQVADERLVGVARDLVGVRFEFDVIPIDLLRTRCRNGAAWATSRHVAED